MTVGIYLHPPPQDPPPAIVQMVEACSRALAPDECQLRAPGVRSSTDRSSATVELTGAEPDRVRIWLRHADASLSVEELQFAAQDDPLQRWRSVGLVIAAMTRANEESATQSSFASRPEVTDVAEPRDAGAREGSGPPSLELVAAAELGSGFRDESLRAGILGLLSYRISKMPLGVMASGSVSTPLSEPTSGLAVRWLEWGVGLSLLPFVSEQTRVWLGFEFAQQGVTADATSKSGVRDSGTSWRDGARVTARTAVRLGDGLSLDLGGRFGWFAEEPTIFVENEVAARSLPFTLAGHVGLNLDW